MFAAGLSFAEKLTPAIDGRMALACDLLSQSAFEVSSRAQFVTLITALETLVDRQPVDRRLAALVDKWVAELRSEDLDGLDSAGVKSFEGQLLDLKRQAIGRSVRELSRPTLRARRTARPTRGSSSVVTASAAISCTAARMPPPRPTRVASRNASGTSSPTSSSPSPR